MTGENAPVREVPGFARVGQAARRAFLGLTTPLFGTPGEPTKLGKAMDLVDEAASAGLMTYGASAARLGRAGRFAEMSRRGARPETVLRRTGYQKGPFGYGVETRGDAYFRPAALFDGGRGAAGKLGDVADVHPDVATAYPGVERDVAVRLVPDSEWAARVAEARERISAWSRGETSKGFFDRSGMEVNVRGKMPSETLEMYMDRADKTLSHELQHAAHEMDGIPPPKRGDFEWYRTDAREVDARNSANRNLLTAEERVEMPRANTQDVRPSEVHLADRGGDSPHKNFHNFLATDDVPETLFGFPVVQREGDYTEADLKFFKENPKAAGFYDMGEEGEEEIGEEEPRQAVGEGAGDSASHVYEDETDKTVLGWVSAQHNGLPGAPRLVSKASTRHFAGTDYRRGATWVTPADSPFGEVEYFLDLANGSGARANRVVVRTPESRSPETAIQLADYILKHHDRGDGRFGAIDRNDLERELYLHMQALADSKSSPAPVSEFSSPNAYSDPGAALGSMLGQALANRVVRRHAEFTDIMHNDPKMDKLERQYGKWSDIREKHMSGKHDEEVK